MRLDLPTLFSPTITRSGPRATSSFLKFLKLLIVNLYRRTGPPGSQTAKQSMVESIQNLHRVFGLFNAQSYTSPVRRGCGIISSGLTRGMCNRRIISFVPSLSDTQSIMNHRTSNVPETIGTKCNQLTGIADLVLQRVGPQCSSLGQEAWMKSAWYTLTVARKGLFEWNSSRRSRS